MSDLLMADLFFCSLHCLLMLTYLPCSNQPINQSTAQLINQST